MTLECFPLLHTVLPHLLLITVKQYLTLVTPWTIATRLLSPWDFPGRNTGGGCHFLLPGIFLTQGQNPHLLHWQVDFFPPSHQGSPYITKGLFTAVSSPEYVMSTLQQKITRHTKRLKQTNNNNKKKPQNLKRPNQHQNQSQIWQECWNYQTRIIFF